MPQVTGVVFVFINGEIQRSKEGSKLNTGGWERTAHMTGPIFHGHSKKPVPATIEYTGSHMADTDLEALNNLEDATVRFETDTGTVYIVTKAATTKPTELTGGEGEFSVEISGAPAVKE